MLSDCTPSGKNQNGIPVCGSGFECAVVSTWAAYAAPQQKRYGEALRQKAAVPPRHRVSILTRESTITFEAGMK